MVYERSGKYEKSKEHFWQTFFDNTNTLFIYSSDMCYCYVVDNLINTYAIYVFTCKCINNMNIWRSCGIDYSSQIYQVELFYT